jgi:uracil-DNA glycosylase family 4
MERWLREELNLLKPKYILMLGANPLKAMFNVDGITSKRGTWYLLQTDSFTAECLPTYHPSYVMRVRNMELGNKKVAEFLADIREMAMTAGFLPEDAPSVSKWHSDFNNH